MGETKLWPENPAQEKCPACHRRVISHGAFIEAMAILKTRIEELEAEIAALEVAKRALLERPKWSGVGPRRYKCSRCGQPGHNRASCKVNPMLR